MCADGGFGYPEAAPYDRIILTVGADDLAPAWREQLAPGGRLVIPLGLTPLDVVTGAKALTAFDRVADHLESASLRLLLMVPLRGAFARGAEGVVPLGPEPGIDLWSAAPVDAARLYEALGAPYREFPVGVGIAPFASQEFRLWVALHEPSFCELYAKGTAMDRGIVPDLIWYPRPIAHTFGVAVEGTLCALTGGTEQPHDLVARCYGPDVWLAQRLIGHVRAYQDAGHLGIQAYAPDARHAPVPGERIIDLPSTRLVITW